jgi:hypothetical protein
VYSTAKRKEYERGKEKTQKTQKAQEAQRRAGLLNSFSKSADKNLNSSTPITQYDNLERMCYTSGAGATR